MAMNLSRFPGQATAQVETLETRVNGRGLRIGEREIATNRQQGDSSCVGPSGDGQLPTDGADIVVAASNAVFPHTHGRPGLILSVESLEIRAALCLARDCSDRLITKTCPNGTLSKLNRRLYHHEDGHSLPPP
jgi:hypothetical protein